MSEENASDFDRQMQQLSARIEALRTSLSQPTQEQLRARLESHMCARHLPPDSVTTLQERYAQGQITIEELNERLPAALEREPEVVPVVQEAAPFDPIGKAWDALKAFFRGIQVGIQDQPLVCLCFLLVFIILLALSIWVSG